MGHCKQVAGVGSRPSNPAKALHELVRYRTQRNRNLRELKNLNSIALEDIGLFEYTREQIVRSN